MKKIGLLFFIIAFLIGVSSLTAFADMGPKPSLSIEVSNYCGGSCYLDLLSRDGGIEYDDLSYRYKESDKELPIYKYNEDGWLATHIRSGILWGELTPTIITETLSNGDLSYSLNSRFSYFGIPKLFKIIIQLKSGDLYVSTKEYDVTEYNQITKIDFVKDMIKVAKVNEGYKISGYIKPELFTTRETSDELYQGFTVEAVGTGLKGITDTAGYFEIAGIANNSAGYKLNVSKPGFLKRTVDITAVQGDLLVNSKETPILIWPGDISNDNKQDDAINMADVMCLAKAFNTVMGEEGYRKDIDLNIDGSVNMSDIMLIAKHFNATINDYPACVLPKVTPEPTPVLTKVFGKLVWNSFEGGFYGVVSQDEDGKVVQYDIGEGLPGIEECLYGGNLIEITGCPRPGMSTTHQWGTPFELVSYMLIDPMKFSGILPSFPVTSPMVTPVTPTPTPVLTKVFGKLVWNSFEGGFYGVVGEDEDGNTVQYDIGEGLPGIEECLNGGKLIEITGCPQPGIPTTHQWGTPFELVSYMLIDPMKISGILPSFPVTSPTVTSVTPTPKPVLKKVLGKLVRNSIEGGFYGVLSQDEDGKGVEYDIGQGLPGIEEGLESWIFIEITGYTKPGAMSFHMKGIPFELVSYKLIDPRGFN